MAYMKDYRGRRLDSFSPGRDARRIASYDASILTQGNGVGLSVWPDSGGSMQDLVMTATGTQPSVNTNSLNGLRTVHFDATDYITNSAFGNGFENGGVGYSQPLTLAAVYRISSSGARNTVTALTGWLSPASSNRLSLQIDTQGAIALYGANFGVVGGKPVNDDQWHITIAQFDTASSSFYTDGYLIAATNSQAHGANVLKGFAIGAACDGTAPVGICDVAQVDVIGGRLTRGEVDAYTQRLATKWGLS